MIIGVCCFVLVSLCVFAVSICVLLCFFVAFSCLVVLVLLFFDDVSFWFISVVCLAAFFGPQNFSAAVSLCFTYLFFIDINLLINVL